MLYSPFFQNKFVLYASLFAVLITLLRFLANHNFNGVILLTLIGLLMTYFSKNMIIVLLTAFVSVTVLDMLQLSGSIEGMKSSKEGEETLKKKDDEDSKKEDSASDDAKKEDSDSDAKKDSTKKDEVKPESSSGSTGDSKPKSGSGKQGMTKMSPANYDGKDHGDDKTNGNRIDYASTLEQAYDNIENIIGEDGVRGLTDQTKSLMNQQKQLMENMKDMGPLLKSAEGFMKQITGGGGIGGITEMLKGFAPAKAGAK